MKNREIISEVDYDNGNKYTGTFVDLKYENQFNFELITVSTSGKSNSGIVPVETAEPVLAIFHFGLTGLEHISNLQNEKIKFKKKLDQGDQMYLPKSNYP